MLYEVVTSTRRPGAVPEVEALFSAALPARVRHSPLGAFWHTEIGAMNQTVQVWAYEDLAHREAVHRAVTDEPGWPPADRELTVAERTEIWSPAPFMRDFAPHEYGGIFEMRIYRFRPGNMDRVLEIWQRLVPGREQLSPLVACWVSAIGELDRLCHVWAYPSLDERARIRRQALAEGGWPPMTREWRVGEDVSILLPAAFSPIR